MDSYRTKGRYSQTRNHYYYVCCMRCGMRCSSSISDFAHRRPSNYVCSPYILTQKIYMYTICLLLQDSHHIWFALEFQRLRIQYWFISINSTSITFKNFFRITFWLFGVYIHKSRQQINFHIESLLLFVVFVFHLSAKTPHSFNAMKSFRTTIIS